MVSKEVSCTISQFIFDDILDSFETKGVFPQLGGLSSAASPRILFLCRFPSMVNTARFSRNLFVVGEDEYRNICAVVTGNQPIDIIIYGIQSRLQDNILQLCHSGSQLRHVLLFHECSFSATCIDKTVACALLPKPLISLLSVLLVMQKALKSIRQVWNMLRHGFVPASPSHHRFKLLLQPRQESFDFESIRMLPSPYRAWSNRSMLCQLWHC